MQKTWVKSMMGVVFIVLLGNVSGAADADQGAQNEVQTALEAKMHETIVSVDFKEASMDDVIKALSALANVDMIKSPKVSGVVTANLTDIPLDEALESILAVHGYGYMSAGSVVRVLPLSELEQQKINLTNKIYHIAYAKLSDIENAVKGMLSSQVQMASNEASSHLMVSDIDTQIAMIDQFIEQADREAPQVIVEAKIYDISCSDIYDIGFDWYAGTLTVYDDSALDKVDYALPTSGQLDPYSRRTSGFSSTAGQTETGSGLFNLGVVSGDMNIDVTLKAVRDIVKTKLLASPKILVLDNQQANIKIIKEIPYQQLTQTSAGGNIGTTAFKDAGVELTVTPHVTRDDKIRLDITPKFSVHVGNFQSTPIVDTREATTQALIKSGDTVVIGGLRKSEVVSQTSKVPLMGDLPILGALFRFESDKTIKSELVVFITPRIIYDSQLSQRDDTILQDADKILAPVTDAEGSSGD